MKEPGLKKRKKNEEQEPTPPVVDATGATVGADKHDASDQPAVLSEPVAAGGGGAEACTLGKHVADASSSDNDRKDGSKKTNMRKTDQVTADGEEARLFLVDNTASCTVVDSNDGVINDHGASIDYKKEAGSRVVQDMGHQETLQ
ncbi:unnamed protein product [Miscanthus lutarioriparius]|uniref:Uncharacterized protein n=1 Tax=Miscanthus lutarioriparius TaxID=422564 RepID=A0A811Q0W8_9POAL|nr:unnamed protein product [Miscanthus lutarioriparius]